MDIHSRLVKQLSLSWLKRDRSSFNSASAALTSSGEYLSGLYESRTHLLDVTSEHAALSLAVASKDPHVTKLITVVDGTYERNPLIFKIIGDHVRRTGTTFSYEVVDKGGNLLFHCDDVSTLDYAPRPRVLEKIETWERRSHIASFNQAEPIKDQLYHFACLGLETHFSSTTSSRYAAAVLAGDKIYYSGVYSSFDHRLNLHAEMVCALAAIADGNREITHVAIVSDKFVEEVAHLCGCCRQFFIEIEQKTKVPITSFCFTLDGSKMVEIPLKQYLPSAWDSGLALNDR